MTSEKIDQVKSWLSELARWHPNPFHIAEDEGWAEVTRRESTELGDMDVLVLERKLVVEMYTETHRYNITAIDRRNREGYLGCVASSRSPRPGESWRRGNDLPDGYITRETWDAIKNSIIAYELIDPAPKETTTNATFAVLARALQGAFITASMTKREGHWALPDFAGKGPEDIPKKISRRIISHLCSVMQGVPIEMLPELLVSEDSRVVAAAARRSRYRRYGGTIERLRLLVTKILNG